MSKPTNTITPLVNLGELSRKVEELVRTYHQVHGVWPDHPALPPRACFFLWSLYGPMFRVGILRDGVADGARAALWECKPQELPDIDTFSVREVSLSVREGDEMAVWREGDA